MHAPLARCVDVVNLLPHSPCLASCLQPETPMMFIQVAGVENSSDQGSKSNEAEVQLLVKCVEVRAGGGHWHRAAVQALPACAYYWL
jgi:hypothetical protein